ncbi:MAG: rhomboid family intramembrane serine protease, partial [Pirellulaceae bacterium]|nr:rhomboid family intramembrane serine protease [Pirellulaceae bacterium]
LSAAIYYPITAGIAALSVAATWQLYSGADVSQFMLGYDVWWKELWHCLTTTLFHANIFHLIFNLYWLWAFGTKVESEFGHPAMIGIFVLLGVGSSAAEYALLIGGIGLSGVVYGLFGLLWILGRSERRFSEAIDRSTVHLFIVWFFFCILTTVAGVWQIANIAHGMGFVLGALLGWTLAERGRARRARNAALLAAVFLLCAVGGTAARPYINLTSDAGRHLAYQGYLALEEEDNEKAATLYERAVAINPNMPDWWNNLGVAYVRLGRIDDAQSAFQRKAELEPKPPPNR